MNRPPALSLVLVLVLLLAACQAVQPPAAAPAQAQQGGAASAAATSQAPDQELAQKLQAALEAAVAGPDTNWPGAVLTVHAPALGVWSGAAGLGEVATNTAMRPHDRFRAGSLTKPFIATVTLQLVEEGRFALDDPIAGLLPERVAAKFPAGDQITVRMLLNHTSGLPDFMDLAGPEVLANPARVWEEEELLDFAAAQEPWFTPGEAQYYSNTGYALLGLVIQEATGRPWREEMRRRILAPLGLENTLLPAPEDSAVPGDHAHGYGDFGAGLADATEAATASIVGAAGGQSLVTNAPDLATFLEALLAGRLFQKSETLDEMLTFVAFAPDHPLSVILTGYGLGLEQADYGEGLSAIGHSGDTVGGYSSFVFRFPEQAITIAGAVNTLDPAAGYAVLMPRVLELLAPGYTMPEATAAEPPDVATMLQGFLDDQVREQDILGMAMAVRLADGTVIIKTSGYIDPAGERPWSEDTVSPLGSVTKTYTAVVIMQLVEEGRLSLDETIDAWFPDQPNGERITVRMLLTHTSGLSNFIPPENERDPTWAQEWTPLELVDKANRRGPVAEPGGDIAHYTNTSYFLLGLIVEAITGNSWEEEVRSRIFEPLGLHSAAFAGDDGVWDEVVMPGYFKLPDGYLSSVDVPDYPHPSTAWAAGGVVSDLPDLMAFAAALFDGALVSPETLAQMATPVAKDAESGLLWGFGGATMEMLPPGSFGMGGDVPGYHAFFSGLQGTKLVVAALVNTEQGDVIGPSLAVFQYLYSLLPAKE